VSGRGAGGAASWRYVAAAASSGGARGTGAQRAARRCQVAPSSAPALLLEATFSGQADGIWFRITQEGVSRVFSRDQVARHPALSAVLRLIADEVELLPGGAAAVAKPLSQELLAFLCHGLLVYVQRLGTPLCLVAVSGDRPLRDPRIERALELLNTDIARRWTVELLARAVGVSRPVFARQFLRVLGLSPMRYLTQRRLQIAAALLLGSDAALAEVAACVGYHSEFAFSRAFRRQYQVPPGLYRQRTGTLVAPLAVAPTASVVALRMAA
jgi:AraC-like DNA-binding protein